MAAPNKAQFLADVQTILKKRFKPGPAAPRMTVLEAVVFAICRENSTREQANQVLSRFKDGFFDWNEIRVSSIAEIEETLAGLSDTEERAFKIRRFLRQLFQKTYGFSLEALQKKPLKEALKALSNYEAFASDYVEASVVLLALGGHAIPVDKTTRRVLGRLGMIDPKDDDKMLRAHLERAVPKNRAVEFIDLIEDLGHDTCIESTPHCDRCDLRKICPKMDPPPIPFVEPKPKPESEPVVEAKSTSSKASKSATSKNGVSKPASKSKSSGAKAEAKVVEPKTTDAKQTNKPSSEPKPPETKHSEPKRPPSEAKHAEAKHAEAKHAEAKHTEAKHAEAKHTEAKHTEAKHTETKHTEAKHTETKHTEAKHTEAKHTEAKHTEAKLAGTKHGEAKLDDVKRIDKQTHDIGSFSVTETKHEKEVVKAAAKAETKHEPLAEEKPATIKEKDPKAHRADAHASTKSETKTTVKASDKAERPVKSDENHPAPAQASHSSSHKTKTEPK